jgi:hypothetical protein
MFGSTSSRWPALGGGGAARDRDGGDLPGLTWKESRRAGGGWKPLHPQPSRSEESVRTTPEGLRSQNRGLPTGAGTPQAAFAGLSGQGGRISAICLSLPIAKECGPWRSAPQAKGQGGREEGEV